MKSVFDLHIGPCLHRCMGWVRFDPETRREIEEGCDTVRCPRFPNGPRKIDAASRCCMCQRELKPHEYQICEDCDFQTG